jgi:hypothetical protein
LGEKYKYVTKSGSSYTFTPPGGDESTEAKLGRGYDAARTFLRDNPKVRTELLKHVRKSLKEEKATGGSDE